MTRRAAEFGITGADASGMDLVIGAARFVGERTVEVMLDGGTLRTLLGTDVVINTGMVPFVPDIPGLRAAEPLTSTTILVLASLPESIVILGGGYIGCEFASMLAIMGVEVSLLQRGPSLLPREDADIAQAVSAALAADGVHVLLNTEARSVARTGGSVTVELSGGGTLSAADLLVATGRTPVTAGLGLAAAGVELSKKGTVQVDEFLRTSAPHVWAAWDVAGSPQFTHASWNDYRILKSNLAGGSWSTVGQLDGLWQAVVERGTDRILGASLLAHGTP